MSTYDLISLQEESKDSNKLHEVWLRISAFLDLKAPHTQRTYLGVVKEWCQFLGAEAGTEAAAKLVLKAEDLHAIAYQKWLRQRPGQNPRLKTAKSRTKQVSTNRQKKRKSDGLQSTQSNATIAKKFAALRRIYRMLIAADLGISANPFDTDKVPPPSSKAGQKRPTEMLAFEKIKDILSLPKLDHPKGVRDLALLSLLFGAGLRRSELVNLRIGDVKKTNKGTCFLYLRATKARKDAEQAVPAWAAKPLLDYCSIRTEQGALEGDVVFNSYRGRGGLAATNEALSTSGVYKLFKNYCRLAGAGDFVTPHSARATAITKLLADGFGHREVQEFSRHASVQMVEVYDKRRISVDENPGNELSYD